MDDSSLLLTLNGARDILGGIAMGTLDKLAANGDVTKVKIGRRAFITRASVLVYLDRLAGEAETLSAGTA